MKKKLKVSLIVFLVALIALLASWYLSHQNIAVLNPAGIVAEKERNLLFFALGLSAVVVVPVFALTIFIAWRYREGNHSVRKKYSPDFSHSRLFESLWWGIPAIIILILSVVTWESSYALNPYKALADGGPHLAVDVVALDWKWLFIYPQQHIASVNELAMPVNTPVTFQLTSDTVMNSFWVPNLGSQIYAMPGMNTQLNLEANKLGSYPGSSANISGSGFASMRFSAVAMTASQFQAWVAQAKHSPYALTAAAYATLSKHTTVIPIHLYAHVAPNLYNSILDKYMAPGNPAPSSSAKVKAAPAGTGMQM